MKKQLSILFLSKENDPYCEKVRAFLDNNFSDVVCYLSKWGDKFPQELYDWEGDYIISYLSRWVIPDEVLQKAKKAAINFHPASPEYPGIGCNNFALYEDAETYGATCHHMLAKVDTGSIIAVKRFKVYPSDTVASLLARTYDHQLVLFYEIAARIYDNQPLPMSAENWTRKPFTRKEFNQLFEITPDMDEAEVRRRVRAIDYLQWKPRVTLHGYTFELKHQAE